MSTGKIFAMNADDPNQASINNLSIRQDLAGTLVVMGTVHNLSIIDGSVTPTAWIDVGGDLDSFIIGPDGLSIGQNFAGTLTVEHNLCFDAGWPAVCAGWLRAGYIGDIAVYGGYGPVVLRYMEHGVERQVEMGTAGVPFPLGDNQATAGALNMSMCSSSTRE